MAGPSPVLAALPPTTMATPSPSGLPMGAKAEHATEQAGQWMQRLGSISTMPGPLGLIAPVGHTEMTSGISQPLSLSTLIGGRSRWTATLPMSAQEPSPQLLMQPEPEIFNLAGRQSVWYSLSSRFETAFMMAAGSEAAK